MVNVIWHGRGGQGAFTGARLLGAAWCLGQGHQALAFPSFGPERRGAPMRAFTKLDVRPIGDRSACERADVVVYLDDTLFAPGWEEQVKPGGCVLLNSAKSVPDERVRTLDANSISARILGRAIPNTALLAALTGMIDGFTRNLLEEAIRQNMPVRLHEKNIEVVDYVCSL